MKFDFEPEEFDELDEQAPNPRTLDAVARPEDDTAEFASPAFRMYRAFDHAQVRTRADIARVRSALNQMHHTLEVVRAQEKVSESPAKTPTPDVFRPEAFRARPSN